MLSKDKGFIILPTLIIFSILSTIILYSINLAKTNFEIVQLDYDKAILEERSYGNLQLVLSNILSEIEVKSDILINEKEFNDYFNSNEFYEKIKLEGITIIPNLETLDIDFTIKSICENGDLSKIYTSKVHIKNPFLTEEYEDIKDLLVYSIKEF